MATLEYQGEVEEAGAWVPAFDWQAAATATVDPSTAGALPLRVRGRSVTAGAQSEPGEWSEVRTLTYDPVSAPALPELAVLTLSLPFPRTVRLQLAMPRTITRTMRF